MQLREYIRQQGLTYRSFGDKIGRDGAEVWRWANGHRLPPVDVAVQIEDATGGKVTVRDLVSVEPA